METLIVKNIPYPGDAVLETALNNRKTIRLLDMRNLGLGELPPWVSVLESLEYLLLEGNNIATLPLWVTELPNIKRVYLDGNPATDNTKVCRKTKDGKRWAYSFQEETGKDICIGSAFDGPLTEAEVKDTTEVGDSLVYSEAVPDHKMDYIAKLFSKKDTDRRFSGWGKVFEDRNGYAPDAIDKYRAEGASWECYFHWERLILDKDGFKGFRERIMEGTDEYGNTISSDYPTKHDRAYLVEWLAIKGFLYQDGKLMIDKKAIMNTNRFDKDLATKALGWLYVQFPELEDAIELNA